MRPRPRSSRRWRAISIASIIRTFTPLPFLQGDAKAMEQQVAWAAGKLGKEDLLLSLQSDTEAYAGHVEKARWLSRRAVEVAKHFDLKEPADCCTNKAVR